MLFIGQYHNFLVHKYPHSSKDNNKTSACTVLPEYCQTLGFCLQLIFAIFHQYQVTICLTFSVFSWCRVPSLLSEGTIVSSRFCLETNERTNVGRYIRNTKLPCEYDDVTIVPSGRREATLHFHKTEFVTSLFGSTFENPQQNFMLLGFTSTQGTINLSAEDRTKFLSFMQHVHFVACNKILKILKWKSGL